MNSGGGALKNHGVRRGNSTVTLGKKPLEEGGSKRSLGKRPKQAMLIVKKRSYVKGKSPKELGRKGDLNLDAARRGKRGSY